MSIWAFVTIHSRSLVYRKRNDCFGEEPDGHFQRAFQAQTRCIVTIHHPTSVNSPDSCLLKASCVGVFCHDSASNNSEKSNRWLEAPHRDPMGLFQTNIWNCNGVIEKRRYECRSMNLIALSVRMAELYNNSLDEQRKLVVLLNAGRVPGPKKEPERKYFAL